MGTMANMQRSFAGECQAIRKYFAFAEKAENEGYRNIAMLFRALVVSETAHADAQLALMNEVKSTRENLAAALNAEEYESKGLYPQFIKEAEKENNHEAVECFKNAHVGEQVHFSLLIEALKKIEAGQELSFENIFVCRNCGGTTLEKPDKICDICGGDVNDIDEIY
jgi:rubrerythrin